MKRAPFRYFAPLLAVAIAAGGFLASRSFTDSGLTLSVLSEQTHFHGIAVNPTDPSSIYLATHHGLYVVSADGTARQVSKTRDDFMGFTAHPTDSSVLFASGHSANGGNLGFIASTDGGQSWRKLSDGIDGPVDFHQMDVSKTDPTLVYGVYSGLQRSIDGGRTWTKVGPVPDGLIDLAASGKDAYTLYAATKSGLLKSADGGRSWQPAHVIRRPATMVHVAGRGEVYAFIIGTGLIRAADGGVNWQLVSNAFGEAYVLHLTTDERSDRKLYVITLNSQTRAQAVLVSKDKGASWAPLGAN